MNSQPFIHLQDPVTCSMTTKITGFSYVTPCILVVTSKVSGLKMVAACSMTTKITGFSYVTPCIFVVTSKLSASKMVAAFSSETSGVKYHKRLTLIYFAAL